MSLPQTSKNYLVSDFDPRVIYIHSNLFTYMPNLIKHVRSLHQASCGSDIGICVRSTCDTTLCDTTLVIFLNITQPIDPNQLEQTYYKNILAFYTIEWYRDTPKGNFVEIY